MNSACQSCDAFLGLAGWPAGADAAGGVGDFEDGAVDELRAPPRFVHDPMVGSAEADEVLELGGPAVSPPFDVMSVGPGGGPVTAGEPAALVADDQCGPQVGF